MMRSADRPRPARLVTSTVKGGTGLSRVSLRTQFSAVIFLLAFLPNLGVTLMSPVGLTLLNLLWILLVGLLSALIGYLLSGALLRSLSRLETEVQHGDFSNEHADDPSEIRSLRLAFTGLMGRLGTEQARRNAFMATLVHDLKTPLIATGHLTQALTTLPLPEPERREVGAQIQAETTRLLALVQQMAEAHRFEREDVNLNLQDVNLSDLLGSVARRLEAQAQLRGISIQVTGEGHALADPAVLERAVTNLAENALRYAQAYVELRVNERGVSVMDDGPGLNLPLDDLAQPFNAQPALIAGQQYTAGTAGLGLFIARRIAEAHGGHLSYERCVPETNTPLPPNHPVPSQPSYSQTSPHHSRAVLAHPPPGHAAPSAPLPRPLTSLTIHLPEVTP